MLSYHPSDLFPLSKSTTYRAVRGVCVGSTPSWVNTALGIEGIARKALAVPTDGGVQRGAFLAAQNGGAGCKVVIRTRGTAVGAGRAGQTLQVLAIFIRARRASVAIRHIDSPYIPWRCHVEVNGRERERE